MTEQPLPAVMTLGVAGLPTPRAAIDVYAASSLREAVSTLRLVGIDLVLAGTNDPRLDVLGVMQRLLAAWPHQRWILASSQLTPQEEIMARSLGATMVFHSVPDECWVADFITSVQRRQGARRIPCLAPPLAIGADWSPAPEPWRVAAANY